MKKSVRKRNTGSGAATAFNPNFIAIDVEDILHCPEANESGIIVESDLILKVGASPKTFYITPDTIKLNADSVGEIDQEGFEVKGEGYMPGDNIATKEFSVEVLKTSYIVLIDECKGDGYRMLGDCCNPIRISTGVELDKDKTLTKVMLKRPLNTDIPIRIYKGSLTFAEPAVAASENLDLTIANGTQYNIDNDVTGALTINSNEFEHGQNLSLVGGGGNAPATLSASGDVLLKDGLAWEALKGSTITLKVFEDGATKKLVEVSRS